MKNQDIHSLARLWIIIFNNEISHVGQVIYSTTLDTEAKVKAIYGTSTSWTQITNKFIIGASSTYTVKSTGGTTSISSVPSHTHSFTPSGTISVTANPSFSGSTGYTNTTGNHTHQMGGRLCGEGSTRYEIDSINSTHVWSGADHMTPEGDHYHSYTPSGTISGGSYSFSGTAGTTGSTGNSSVSVLNPYYAVYIWVRTA